MESLVLVCDALLTTGTLRLGQPASSGSVMSCSAGALLEGAARDWDRPVLSQQSDERGLDLIFVRGPSTSSRPPRWTLHLQTWDLQGLRPRGLCSHEWIRAVARGQFIMKARLALSCCPEHTLLLHLSPWMVSSRMVAPWSWT